MLRSVAWVKCVKDGEGERDLKRVETDNPKQQISQKHVNLRDKCTKIGNLWINTLNCIAFRQRN